ncbi:hypothetical protein [Phormidium sp. CCY1219]|uniref:hypothetical protein n=1 Tax=Phormidium sp. CCY1219 TaxID=2886104 RepID=UPI002D1F78AD|nr:hypothetical protein [Phormidium sp. CCY1219]MEB3827707.1 hypothetical protein [Phormidium sp. CCY1219]
MAPAVVPGMAGVLRSRQASVPGKNGCECDRDRTGCPGSVTSTFRFRSPDCLVAIA